MRPRKSVTFNSMKDTKTPKATNSPDGGPHWLGRLVGPLLRFLFTSARSQDAKSANWLCRNGFYVVGVRATHFGWRIKHTNRSLLFNRASDKVVKYLLKISTRIWGRSANPHPNQVKTCSFESFPYVGSGVNFSVDFFDFGVCGHKILQSNKQVSNGHQNTTDSTS